MAENYLAVGLDTVKSHPKYQTLSSYSCIERMPPMNTVNTFEPTMEDAMTHTDKIDNSFPYVLVSSLSATLVSLAAVWAWTATTLGPVAGA
jgi:hypothetical protein